MHGDTTVRPEDVLEDIAYLSRSTNRVQILEVIATEAHTPRNIAEVTDVPRSTLRRILTEMVERGWAKRTTDGEYVATRTGGYVAVETERYISAIHAIRTLGEAVSWLPEEELTIGLQHFREATVQRPEPNAVGAADTRLIDLFQTSDTFLCLVNTAPTIGLERTMVESVVEGDLHSKHIITNNELAVLRQDADRSSRWRTYVEAGADLYCYEGRIPCNLLIFDGTMLLGNRRLESIEFIESENQTVCSWGRELIDSYREEAEPLDAGVFAEASTSISGKSQ